MSCIVRTTHMTDEMRCTNNAVEPLTAYQGLTNQVEVGQDDVGQEPVHVELNAAILHVLCNDGLDRAQGQHAGLMDLPPGRHRRRVTEQPHTETLYVAAIWRQTKVIQLCLPVPT